LASSGGREMVFFTAMPMVFSPDGVN